MEGTTLANQTSLSKKTVDEIWREIQQSKNNGKEKTGERKPTPAEMSFEEFLSKAGAVAESYSDQNVVQQFPQQGLWMQHPQPQYQHSQQSMTGQPMNMVSGAVMDVSIPENQVALTSTSVGTMSYPQTLGRKRGNPEDMIEKTVERGQFGQESIMVREENEKKRRRGKSEVWKHFTDSGKGDGKVICNHCGGEFDGSSKKGTTHLRNHLKSMKCRVKRNGDKSTKTRDLATPVVMNEKSSSVIDLINNSFEHWDPSVLKSRKTEILQVYKEEKEKLGEFLNKLSCRFSLEVVWLYERRLLIVHYIDDSWEHQMRIISQWLDNEKNGIEEMKESCLAWKIDTNICSVLGNWFRDCDDDKKKVIESWFSERGSLPFAGFVPHFRHFIGDILIRTNKWETIKIDGLRECVDYVYKTSSNQLMLQCAVNYAKTMGKNVIFSDTTLWWYDWPFEYIMIAVGLKEAFSELEKMDPDFISINLTKQKWDEATATFDHFNSLKELRNSLDDDERPTIEVVDIWKLLRCNRSEDCHVCKSVNKFVDKIKVYFVVVILDPRFKMDTIKRWYEEIYGNDAAVGYLDKTIQDFRDVYNKYAKNSRDYTMMNDTSSTKSELDHYLHELKVRPVKEFDILAWWRGNALVYPILAKMARDYLAVTINRTCINKNQFSFIEHSGIDYDIIPALIYLRGLPYF